MLVFNFMFDLLGFTSILLVCLITLLIGRHWREAASILYIALLVRFY